MTDIISTISPSDYFSSTPHRQLADNIISRARCDHEQVDFIERVGRKWELTVYTARHPEVTTKVVKVSVVGDE